MFWKLNSPSLFILALLLNISITLFWFYGKEPNFPLDDAYIHLVYARNIAEGKGFSFNADEPSYGSSTMLWVFLLAFFSKFISPLYSAILLSFVFLFLSTLMVFFFARESAEKKNIFGKEKLFYTLFPGLFFALNGNLIWICYSGMESSLFLLLVLCSIYFLVREDLSLKGFIFLGLSFIARVEAIVGLVIMFLYLFFSRRDKKRVVLGFSLSTFIILPFYIYSCSVMHRFFPTTASGKLASNLFNAGFSLKGISNYILRHFFYLYRAEPEALLSILVSIFLCIFLLLRTKERKFQIDSILLLCLWALCHFLFHALAFRSTSWITPYHNLRYQVLFFPALSLALIKVVLATRKVLNKNWQKYVLALVVLAILFLSTARLSYWKKLYWNQVKRLEFAHQRAGKWAKENLPEDARIACFDIGSLGYFSERYIIDLGGLIDSEVHPYLERVNAGEYIKLKRATHYFELVRPPVERIVGVRKEDGRLYELVPIVRFDAMAFGEPVFLHSFGIVIYEIKYRP